MPAVSVIVPNYNHARFLNQRIDTILNQTFKDFELILLDDCSSDDSRSILSSYASDPRVRLEFNEKNSGSTFKQWNKGVRLARGEYVWIAESDDYADPHLLEALVAALNQDNSVAFAYCRSWRVTGEGYLDGYADLYLVSLNPTLWTADFTLDGREACQKYFIRTNPVPNASAVLFPRSLYEQVGGADETHRICGDWKLWAAMSLHGKIRYVGQPLNYFRFHTASVRKETERNRLAIAEYLRVVRWLMKSVSPASDLLETLCKEESQRWIPALMSLDVPFERKLTILRNVIHIDPHPLRRAIRPALTHVRLKLQRHWRELTSSMRPARQLWAWWTCRTPRLRKVVELERSIATLSPLESPTAIEESDSEAPIFLFSTGMRTGSTLLQRILITDSRLLLWGEPMGEMNVATRITEMLSDGLSREFLGYWQRQPSPSSPDLAKSWIAHLHPSSDNFRLGLRRLFDAWLGCPARRSGFSRWGFKEVRLGATSAVLLHWLYPNAKFILLTRHPFDCYRSFADAGWEESHFVQYPNHVVNSAAGFAREWNRIAMSWSELPADFPSMLIKYEDLTSGNFDFRGLESWLGLKLNESEALSEKVGRTAFRARLHAYERWIISREAASGMSALGYSKKGA